MVFRTSISAKIEWVIRVIAKSVFYKKRGNGYKKLETLEIMSPVSPDDGSLQLMLGSKL